MNVRISCIVEGDGEIDAVPNVIRRIASSFAPDLILNLQRHDFIRVSRSKLLRSGELERSVEQAARRIGGRGAVLILLDSDDDCPAHLGPQLLARATGARPDLPMSVVLAHREFEAWFLAAAESLRGKRGLPMDLVAPAQPESIRDAKGWLRKQMAPGGTYKETLDQPALAACFDLEMARRAASFDKFYRDVIRLLGALR